MLANRGAWLRARSTQGGFPAAALRGAPGGVAAPELGGGPARQARAPDSPPPARRTRAPRLLGATMCLLGARAGSGLGSRRARASSQARPSRPRSPAGFQAWFPRKRRHPRAPRRGSIPRPPPAGRKSCKKSLFPAAQGDHSLAAGLPRGQTSTVRRLLGACSAHAQRAAATRRRRNLQACAAAAKRLT